MADILSSVAKYFKPREVSVDNAAFQLFTTGSVVLFLLGSLMCAATQYFGDPIVCYFEGSVDEDLVKQYCWIHGSSWVPERYAEAFDCRVDPNRIKSVDNPPDTSYYQWVIFFLLLQAALFAFPRHLWKMAEGGLVKGFRTDEVRSALVLSDDSNVSVAAKQFVRHFKSVLHHNNRYFATFVLCEALNVVFVIISYLITDSFLNGHFSNYGFSVLRYYRQHPSNRDFNPMCNVFPTKVSCSMNFVAPTGGEALKSGLCILSQNIVNEKVFLVLYFWYVLLFAASALLVVYRVVTIVLPQFRTLALRHKIRGRKDVAEIDGVMRQCYVGDWFLLSQLEKNVDPYFYREFVARLAESMGVASERRRWSSGGGGSDDDLVKFGDEKNKDSSEETVPLDRMDNV